MTDGTSAQFTNQFVPLATVRASLQPLSVRSAKRSVALSPDRSTQLRTMRSPSADSCGCALFAAAGDDNGVTFNDQPAPLGVACGSPRADEIAAVRAQRRTTASL